MRIFLTGATGYIGSAITKDLLEVGHQVVGLARSDASAAALVAAGAEVHRGNLDDFDSLKAGASAADGVIHNAFNNISETTDFVAASQADLAAVEAIGSALEGTDKPFIVTSGTLLLTPGRLGTENDAPDPVMGGPRVPTEIAVHDMASRGIRSAVVRLAPTVHGVGDNAGFISTLISLARAKGASAYVGDGSNLWPAVQRLDAARLFRLGVESAPAGSRLHGAGEEGVPFKDIAEAIGRKLDLPTVSVSTEDAPDHFGFLAFAVATDNPTSNKITRELLGWDPTHPKVIEDIEEGHYFKG